MLSPSQTTISYADAVYDRPVHEQELVLEKATQTMDVMLDITPRQAEFHNTPYENGHELVTPVRLNNSKSGHSDPGQAVRRAADRVPSTYQRPDRSYGRFDRLRLYVHDAARGYATGHGAFTFVGSASDARMAPRMLHLESKWQPHVQRALVANTLSMPAGECFGAVLFADALARVLPGLMHLVVFTDSVATARAFTSDNSGAPQLNAMVRWL